MSKTVTGDGKMPAAGVVAIYPELTVDPYNGHAYVDLGLPSGLKWATMNVGATQAEESGDYFAWGETEPYYNKPLTDPISWKKGKEGYIWASYFDTNDEGSTFIKYNTNGGKTVLDPEDDAAHVNWGGTWRMATYAEWDELKTECTWTWTTLNGISGHEVKGSNGNTIFLPASGHRDYSSLKNVGSYGYYWSSSLIEFDSSSMSAYSLYFHSNDEDFDFNNRDHGQSVRPVCPKN